MNYNTIGKMNLYYNKDNSIIYIKLYLEVMPIIIYKQLSIDSERDRVRERERVRKIYSSIYQLPYYNRQFMFYIKDNKSNSFRF